VDDWSYGYVDKKNLATFLRQGAAKVSSSDCLAIIRRLDLDCDARLTYDEFVHGLKPEQPFSKTLVREEMKKHGRQPQNFEVAI
jgi:hypothetical protein